MRGRAPLEDFRDAWLREAQQALDVAPRLLPSWKFRADTGPTGKVSLLVWLPWQSPETNEWVLRVSEERTSRGWWQGYSPDGGRVGRSCVSLLATLRTCVVGLVNDHRRRGKRLGGGGH